MLATKTGGSTKEAAIVEVEKHVRSPNHLRRCDPHGLMTFGEIYAIPIHAGPPMFFVVYSHCLLVDIQN